MQIRLKPPLGFCFWFKLRAALLSKSNLVSLFSCLINALLLVMNLLYVLCGVFDLLWTWILTTLPPAAFFLCLDVMRGFSLLWEGSGRHPPHLSFLDFYSWFKCRAQVSIWSLSVSTGLRWLTSLALMAATVQLFLRPRWKWFCVKDL